MGVSAEESRHDESGVGVDIASAGMLLSQGGVGADGSDAVIMYQHSALFDETVVAVKRDDGSITDEDVCH